MPWPGQLILIGLLASGHAFQQTSGTQRVLSNYHAKFWNYEGDDAIDISEIQYSEPSTFAGIPYVRCLNNDTAQDALYDIAVLGAPLDTVRLDSLPFLQRYLM